MFEYNDNNSIIVKKKSLLYCYMDYELPQIN